MHHEPFRSLRISAAHFEPRIPGPVPLPNWGETTVHLVVDFPKIPKLMSIATVFSRR